MLMNIREMRNSLGITQSEFAARYNIPFRTVQNWEEGVRKPPKYVLDLLSNRIELDLVNRKTAVLPKYDPQKIDLPLRGDYASGIEWLQAARECMGESVVFALDSALICQGRFGGYINDNLIWIYGNDSLTRFNDVVIIGNQICSYNVKEKNGLLYTDFNRTVADALANESILDMQGITEGLSNYYYSNSESIEGLAVSPEQWTRFNSLLMDAIEYYNS